MPCVYRRKYTYTHVGCLFSAGDVWGKVVPLLARYTNFSSTIAVRMLLFMEVPRFRSLLFMAIPDYSNLSDTVQINEFWKSPIHSPLVVHNLFKKDWTQFRPGFLLFPNVGPLFSCKQKVIHTCHRHLTHSPGSDSLPRKTDHLFTGDPVISIEAGLKSLAKMVCVCRGG